MNNEIKTLRIYKYINLTYRIVSFEILVLLKIYTNIK